MPIRIAVLGIVAPLLASATAIAQPAAYPTKPIRIVVAYTPAGATDILARTVGQKLNEAWGQAVIIDNRPGANGNIGTEYAAKATPDGYTLLMVTAGTHGINPGLYRKLGFDAVKDFDAGQPGRDGTERIRRQQRGACKRLQRVHRLRQGESRANSTTARPATAARPTCRWNSSNR